MDAMRWFVTSAAVIDYMRICGEDPEDGPAFNRAAARLRALCRRAEFKREYAGGRFESWRAKGECRGKMRRLDLAVSLEQRAEGHADQLVAVKDNDDRTGR
jgi:hypothetical protein